MPQLTEPTRFLPRGPGEAGILSWIQIGDLHMTEAGLQNERDLCAAVAKVNAAFSPDTSFVFLPGDHADHGDAQGYAVVREALDEVTIPWCAIVGDHDVQEGSPRNFLAALSPQLHFDFTVGAVHFVVLNAFDIPEPSSFTMAAPQLAWLEHRFSAARAAGRRTVLLLHCYPGDLKRGRERLQALIAEYRPVLVAMGHTHYNEIANDGRTLYTATRSTGQIEEGPVGFSVTALDGDAVSWRFFPLDQDPCVLIRSPADARLSAAPEGGSIRAKVWSESTIDAVACALNNAPFKPMRHIGSSNVWEHKSDGSAVKSIAVVARTCDGLQGADKIELVRAPRPEPSQGLHEDRFSIGSWPEHGIFGSQLGPNKNGRKWGWFLPYTHRFS